MDDTFFGNDDITELREIRDQLIASTKRGGFQLRKWAANSQTLLDDIPNSYHEFTNHVHELSWSPRDDAFGFVIASRTTPTRRSILSFIAKLYDPLGWTAPVVVSAKMLPQELCSRTIGMPQYLQISCNGGRTALIIYHTWNAFESKCRH